MNHRFYPFIQTLAVLALIAGPYTVRADDVERLDADTALEEIASSKGVVLVDLYADW
jgi:hypothetical protein